jgi:hypothetical protein
MLRENMMVVLTIRPSFVNITFHLEIDILCAEMGITDEQFHAIVGS